MTNVFTCSYRVWEPDMGQPVVCSLTRPKWPGPHTETFALAPQCWPLTPRWSYFRQATAGAQFEAQLARYGPQAIAKALQDIAAEFDAGSLVLLCHETDWTTCHRQRIARFLLETTGWMIRELGEPITPGGALF